MLWWKSLLQLNIFPHKAFEFGCAVWDLFAYPEIGDANIMCTLCTFKQQLAFKMRVHCGTSIVLRQTSLTRGFWITTVVSLTSLRSEID